MTKLASTILVAVALVLAAMVPSQAREHEWRGHEDGGRHRFEERREFHRHWGGPRVFIGIGPSFAWGQAYPYPSYAYAPPPTYWYCPSFGAYYPDIPSCPEPWVLIRTAP